MNPPVHKFANLVHRGILVSFCLLLGMADTSLAQTNNYFGTSGTLNGSVWSTAVGGPYTSALNTTGGAIINFGNATTTITGASITVAGINATANATITTIGGTISNQGNGIVPISVGSGATLDFTGNSFTSSASAGYIKNGAGVLALTGNTYGGGFTLNDGTVILRGVNAMGSGSTLTINGGIIAANATRDLTGKYAGGIVIGGNFTLGATTGLAASAANLTFSNAVNLGSSTRTITLGGTGTYTMSGTISGSGGLNVAATAAGTLALATGNTYTGKTTFSGGSVSATGESTFGANPASFVADQLTFNGGTLLASGGDINFSSNRGITVAAGGGTLNTASTRTITLSNAVTGAAVLTKTGVGTLALPTSQTGFSGGFNHGAGVISVTNESGLGTGPFTWTATNATGYSLNIVVPDGTTWTAANNFVLPSVGAGGEAHLLRIGDASPTASTTLKITGVLSGGAAGQSYTLMDSDTGGNHNAALVLDNAANTFTGTLELWRGTLGITSNGALGNASNTVKINLANNNGGLRFDADNITTASTRTFQLEAAERIDTQAFNATINGNLTGAGSLRKIGSGTLTLAGTSTYVGGGTGGGGTNVAGGLLRVSGGAALPDTGTVSLDNTAGVSLELLSSESIGALSGGGTTGGNVLLNDKTLTLAAATSTTFAGVISGTGGVLAKTGSSVLTLTGTNTYTGGTSLNAGSLNINNSNALGTGALTVGVTATGTFLQVASNDAMTLANDIVLPNPGAALRIDLIKNTASASTGTELNLSGTISGGGNNLTMRVTSNTSGDNTTSYRFVGNNSFSGKVELFRGAITIASPTALGTATLQLNGNNNTTLGDLRFETAMTFANNIELVNTANPDPIHTNGNTVVLSGIISSPGTQNLVKIGAGTLTFTGANTYTVGTTISGGTLQIGNGGTTGSISASSAITNNATLAFNRSDTVTQGTHFSTAAITGTGALAQNGTGTLVLNAANTYSGGTTVSGGGKLEVSNTTGSATGSGNVQVTGGTILGSGTISPASGGSVILGSGATVSVGSSGDTSGKWISFTPASGTTTTNFQTGSTLELDLFSGAGLGDNTANANAADRFRTGGAFEIGTGVKLRVNSALSGYAENDSWQLLDWTTLGGSAPTGTFDAGLLELPTLTGMLSWNLSQLYTTGTISIAIVPEPTRALLLILGLVSILSRRRR